MRLEGRRSSRNLPPTLSDGVVVPAAPNGDCFFQLVCLAIRKRKEEISNNVPEQARITTYYAPAVKRQRQNNGNTKCALTENPSSSVPCNGDDPVANPEFNTHDDFTSISSLRQLVTREYSEEVFELMVAAGQVPCTARTIPTFDNFKNKLLNERAFADEHSIGIVSGRLGIAFLIVDDNIGGKPTMYWNATAMNECKQTKELTSSFVTPKYFMVLRLGREHYSGIKFGGKLLHQPSNLHPQIAKFWSIQLEKILCKAE